MCLHLKLSANIARKLRELYSQIGVLPVNYKNNKKLKYWSCFLLIIINTNIWGIFITFYIFNHISLKRGSGYRIYGANVIINSSSHRFRVFNTFCKSPLNLEQIMFIWNGNIIVNNWLYHNHTLFAINISNLREGLLLIV